MLKYTGHPFIDVGVATIVAFAHKRMPQDVTEDDLHQLAQKLRDWLFTRSEMQKHLLAYYNNALVAQDTYNPPLPPKKPEPPKDDSTREQKRYQRENEKYVEKEKKFQDKRQRFATHHEEIDAKKGEYLDRVLHGFEKQTFSSEGCMFCGSPAIDRASRAQIPLTNGETTINFGPRGQPGQPICGYCLLAVHAMPLGAIKSGGRLLVVHTDQPEWTVRFARRALERNLETLHMLSLGSTEEWPNLSYPKTRLVEALLELQSQGERQKMNSVVAYHFTNYGPSPAIDIFELPSSVIAFVREVESDYHPERRWAWRGTIQRGWVEPKQSRKQDTTSNSGPEIWRNALYDDLFNLPAKAVMFFKRYIWPAHSWELAELFLRKVMNMDPERLKLLYELGTRFAAYTLQRRSFYFEFGREKNYSTWRRNLLRAADDYARQHGELLITADEFVRAFTAPRDAEFNDWKLARDIVMLRIIEERLQQGEVLAEEEALVPEGEQDENPSED